MEFTVREYACALSECVRVASGAEKLRLSNGICRQNYRGIAGDYLC